MIVRSLLFATALIAATAPACLAQSRGDTIATPVLRAAVNVTSDIVRIGDIVDYAGAAAQIPIYRAPDLGTAGSLPVAQVLNTLRAHQVIGVDTRDLKEISVTRLARTLEGKEIEQQVARALERRNGLGDAANLSLTFDRDPGDVKLDPANSGAVQPTAVRYEPRGNRFDVTFEIANENGTAPARLRFTGSAVEMVEAAVLARNVERGDVLKSSDVVVERRPKAELGTDIAARDKAVGMQARRQLRTGQALKAADLVKPDLVQRDQSVTLIYDASGLYLTMRGKALENGTDGDVVNVMNLQSKRTVSGVVSGRGQVSISVATPRPEASAAETARPVSLANASSVAPKAE